MRFLNSLRTKKSRLQDHNSSQGLDGSDNYSGDLAAQTSVSKLPDTLLQAIFRKVCPQSLDDRYATCEDSVRPGECPLCSLEDLTNCAIVNRQWNKCGMELLYRNVRFDAMHFCGRLRAKHKKRNSSKVDDHHDDPANRRLSVFTKTVRRNQGLALLVHTLKIPYMTRETAFANIARAVSAPLTNIAYLDLPEGISRDDPALAVLKAEIEANCREIRCWRISAGGEGYLTRLEHGLWPHLEELTLDQGLLIEPHALARTLKSLPIIAKIAFVNLPSINDDIFVGSSSLPALRELSLQGNSDVTAEGLVRYTFQPAVAQTLKSLRLIETSIAFLHLPKILSAFSCLEALEVVTTVAQPISSSNAPLLRSESLRKLRYEISTSNEPSHVLKSPKQSYYEYLARAIREGLLPSLARLYASSARMPALLLGKGSDNESSEFRPVWLKRTFYLYTKSGIDLQWQLMILEPWSEFTSVKSSTSSSTHPQAQHCDTSASPQIYRNATTGGSNTTLLTVPEQEGPFRQWRKSWNAGRNDEWWAS